MGIESRNTTSGRVPLPAPWPATSRPARPALWLAGGAVLCLVASGGLLWWQGGEAVFASLVTAALAWCF